MTYSLYIGDRTFSSWSLRGWLMLVKFNLPVSTTLVGLYAGTYREELAHLAPARTVPAMQTPDGHILTDSLAMAETLHEENPNAGLYPTDPAARALARSMICELHGGFMTLRGDCPQDLSRQWAGFDPSEGVLSDLDRIETLWSIARSRHGESGPWLFGDYSLADVFYAPVAGRIATYGLPVSAKAQAYVDAHLSDGAFRRWRAMGQTATVTPHPYGENLTAAAWPGPKPLAAQAVDTGPSENATCPYSGKPVTHFLELDGRVFGFCNAFCRDKTGADPEAWPDFVALLNPQ